jgi:TolB protein
MKHVKRLFFLGLGVAVLGLGVRSAEYTGDIVRTVENGAIPVSLEGFSGEALSALRFDLGVQGFAVVEASAARYQLRGEVSGDKLTGKVYLAGQGLLSREYRGASLRALAHAFADDFVSWPAPTGPGRVGIARSRVVFRVESGKASEVMLADYDGYNHVQLTKDGVLTRDPAWVAGRNSILYTSYRTGLPRIYSHDLSSGARAMVAGFPGLNGSPAVSPDGRRVAMILSKGGSPDLYVADVDGSNLKRLTTTKEAESSPCWSPDGRTLCVVSQKDGKAALYTIPSDGGQLKRVSLSGVWGSFTEPSWSPDGKWIAFTCSVGGFQVCVVPAGGGKAEELSQGEDPVWAPNSRTLLFVRRVGGGKVLSMLDVPTKQIKDVRRFSGNCSQPDWVR